MSMEVRLAVWKILCNTDLADVQLHDVSTINGIGFADECQEALEALVEAKRLDLGEMAKDAQINSSGLRSPPGSELLSAEEAFFW